jgi:thiol:disulfide interchange protein
MKGIVLIISVLLSAVSFGQEKITWSFSFDPELSAISIDADIEEGWHLYSQFLDNEFGPIPTKFEYVTNESYKLVGGTVEPQSIKEYDENFEGDMSFFKDNVSFVQKVENTNATSIDGVVTYMVCNDEMCMPPVDLEFSITIN